MDGGKTYHLLKDATEKLADRVFDPEIEENNAGTALNSLRDLLWGMRHIAGDYSYEETPQVIDRLLVYLMEMEKNIHMVREILPHEDALKQLGAIKFKSM